MTVKQNTAEIKVLNTQLTAVKGDIAIIIDHLNRMTSVVNALADRVIDLEGKAVTTMPLDINKEGETIEGEYEHV